MAIVIKPITVEVSKPNIFQAIAAKQNDSNSRFLKVTFANEGEKITVPSNAEVTINAKRNDGLSNSFFGVVNDDGTVTVPIHSWIIALPGYVDCDVSIIEEDSKLTSTTFTILVEEASHGSGDVSDEEQYDFLTEVVKLVAKGKNEVASAVPGAASGSAVALTDISPLEHTLGIKARSENILPYPFYETTKTAGGVTFTDNGDSSLTLKGDATSNITFWLVSPLSERKIGVGAYTISVFADKAISGNAVAMIQRYNESQTMEKAFGETANTLTFTNDKEGCLAIRFFVYSGASFDNVTFRFKLKEGTTATPFTPHIADITTAKLQRYRKNLLPYPFASTTQTTLGITYTDNGDGSITADGISTGNAVFRIFTTSKYFSLPKGEYVVSGGKSVAIYLQVINVDTDTTLITTTGESGVFTLEKESNIRINLGIRSGQTVDNLTFYPQIEFGTNKTEYEPFVEPKPYPIKPDGTVDDVTSLYPTTTLIPDTEGVVLDVDYNVDTKKYIDNKFAELAALIVNS